MLDPNEHLQLTEAEWQYIAELRARYGAEMAWQPVSTETRDVLVAEHERFSDLRRKANDLVLGGDDGGSTRTAGQAS